MDWYHILLILLGIFIIIFLLWIYMIFPGNNKNVNNYKWLFTRPIAHRGYHNNTSKCPENSVVAYKKAIEKNYHIEIDIQLSKDNQVVVFHDDNALRMCNVNKDIKDMTLQEIKSLSLLEGKEKILTLQEFLDLVDDQVGCLIEYKDSQNGKLEKYAWEILKNYHGRWVMQTFNPSTLKWFKKNQPNILRGQLCFNYLKGKKDRPWIVRFLFTNLLGNFIGRPHFISYNYEGIDYKSVKFLRKMKVPLLIWTVNNQKTYTEVINKCDNIIFESLELK